MENNSVSIVNHHQLIACETFLSHLFNKQQWFSCGFQLSQEASFVVMEVLISINCCSMHILTKPSKEILAMAIPI
jgi:hypothetical protein